MRSGPLVVVGDTLLDADIEGEASRISPDAPVPVVECERERHRPGGAGLSALCAARDQSDVVLVTAVGDDEAGRRVEELLADRVSVVRIAMRGGTPLKTRIRAGEQTLLRLDRGGGRVVNEPIGTQAAEVLRSAGAVLVADYGRGIAAQPGIRRLLADLPPEVPLVWDPHPKGPQPLAGARLVTPNEKEALFFASGDGSGLHETNERAAHLVEKWRATGVVITLGARGALLSVGDSHSFVAPAPDLGPGLDACGAGDCFAVKAASTLHRGGLLHDAVTEGVQAASAFVAEGGAGERALGAGHATASGNLPDREAVWSLVSQVRAAGGTVVAAGGCFDLIHAGHVSMLQQARRLGDCLVVCLNSDDSVRRLKGPQRPIMPATDRMRVLQALEYVDGIVVFDEETPVPLLERLQPDVWVKGADYAGVDMPEAEVVRRHGGTTALLPFLDGHSSSRLVSIARGEN